MTTLNESDLSYHIKLLESSFLKFE